VVRLLIPNVSRRRCEVLFESPARSLYAVVSVGGVSTVRVNDAPKAPARSLYAVVSVGGVSTVRVNDAPKAPARSRSLSRISDARRTARVR